VISLFQKQLLSVGRILSLIALAIGLISLCGWVFQIELLKTLLLSKAKIKFNSSLLIIISSLLLSFRYDDPKSVLFFRGVSAILLSIGILTIIEHLFQKDLHIDFLLPSSYTSNSGDTATVRMTVVAAADFTVLGISFLAFSFKKYFTAQLLAILILISIYAVIIAYCFKISTYYDFGKYSAMSFPNAASILLLALSSLFYQPSKGLMKVVTGPRAGSRIIRYFYAYSLLFIPIQLGLYFFLIREYFISPEVGILFVFIVSITVSFPATLFLIHKINDLDKEKFALASQLEQTNRELVDANHELQSIIEEYTVSTEALESTTTQLNESNQALLETNAKLHKLHNELAQMVIDRTADLEYALIELQERNQELDQYVYKVSHDIRSPVASIKGVINLIKLESPADNIRHYLDLVEKRIMKLDDFIQSVLSHSKSLNSPIERESIDFTEIVNQCWGEFEFQEGWKNVALSIVNPPDNFKGDKTRLEIVFKNLLGNGITYRNPKVKSFINICFETTEKSVIIKVSDNGIGIEEKYVEKVFLMFFRGTETSEGSGLGLYIVKQVIDKMEGQIDIASKVSEGTIITITLPL
jgi:signal transduction histidine kinase